MVRLEVLSYPPEGELKGRKVVSSDIFSAEPLEVDEAAARLEQEVKHDFWVFLNAETNRINIIYKRSNGDFGLIDPDV
jgi:putative sigma-54 modulation protein